MSESEWEGGRQSETSKLILTEEQTVVPEQELRLVHLSDALCTSSKKRNLRFLFFPRVQVPSGTRLSILDRRGELHIRAPTLLQAATTLGKKRRKKNSSRVNLFRINNWI